MERSPCQCVALGWKASLEAPIKGTEISYCSDLSGLICGFAFTAAAAVRHLDSAVALAWLRCPRNSDSPEFVWPHFSLSNVNTEKSLREHLSLPEHFFQSLGKGSASTRIEQADDCQIAVVNDVIHDFSYEASQAATLWMCVHRSYVVSVRLHPPRSIDRLRVSVTAGETPNRTATLSMGSDQTISYNASRLTGPSFLSSSVVSFASFMSITMPAMIDPVTHLQTHSSLEIHAPVQTHTILEKTRTTE